MRQLRNGGQADRYHHVVAGFCNRLDEVQAAILRVKLPHLDAWNAARAERAAYYDRRSWPRRGRPVKPIITRSYGQPVYHLYVVRTPDGTRDGLQAYLKEAGISTMIHYPVPVHLQEAYAGLGVAAGAYPDAEELARTVLSLPLYPELSFGDIDRVVKAVRGFLFLSQRVSDPPAARSPLNPALRLRRRLAPIMAPARAVIHRLSTHPALWNLFRRVLENDFRGEKAVIGRELLALTRRAPLAAAVRRPQILDLGCGTGELAPVFLRAGYAYAGIDVEPPRIAYAQRTYPQGQFMVMDAGALGWPDATFDHILVTGVLHHLSDGAVTGILSEMRRVLRTGGRALVMEDIAVGFKLNLLGALVHLADEGSFIRQPDQYAALFAPHFRVQAHYRIRSGVCDYEVFVLVP